MKKILFTIVAFAICLSGFIFATCSNSDNGNVNESETDNETEVILPTRVTPDLAYFSLHGPVKRLTGTREVFDFDENGNLIKVNGEDVSKRFGRDNEGRIAFAFMNGDTLKYTYSDSKQMQPSLMQSMGMSISIKYDVWGYVSSWEGDFGSITYSYSDIDEYGNWLSMKASDGTGNSRKIEYYDTPTTDNQKEMAEFASLDLIHNELHGPVKRMTVAGNTVDFARNGRVIKWNGGDVSEKWERDKEGRLAIEYNNGLVFYYSWDETRPTLIRVPDLDEVVSIQYNEQGFRKKLESRSGEFDMTFTYSDIDEYGNWLTKTTDAGETISREIEYY